MRKKTGKFLVLIISALWLQGCGDICDCFQSTGDLTSEERALPSCSGIYLTSNIDVIVHRDTVRRMRVTAGKNLLDGIETKVESGTLRLKNTNSCNWVRKLDPEIRVEIWTDKLESVFIEDANGDLSFADTLESTMFRMDIYNSMGTYRTKTKTDIITLAIHNGPADIIAEGVSNLQYIYHVGYGSINNLLLDCKQVFINNRGTNDIYVFTKDMLDAKIEYIGNIYYQGSPGTIHQNITGTGKLIKL